MTELARSRIEGFRLRTVPFGHPDAVALIDEVQGEYVHRYGGPDETPVDPAEFTPPAGLFLVGYADGRPVACGGWRTHEAGRVEVKRMYVRPAARGRGLARIVLAELERTALAAGHHTVVLETGLRQPEAIGLYSSSGYTDVAPFGHYACAPGSIHLGKSLITPRESTPPTTLTEETPDADLRAG